MGNRIGAKSEHFLRDAEFLVQVATATAVGGKMVAYHTVVTTVYVAAAVGNRTKISGSTACCCNGSITTATTKNGLFPLKS